MSNCGGNKRLDATDFGTAQGAQTRLYIRVRFKTALCDAADGEWEGPEAGPQRSWEDIVRKDLDYHMTYQVELVLLALRKIIIVLSNNRVGVWGMSS